jgi:hypothetical protein
MRILSSAEKCRRVERTGDTSREEHPSRASQSLLPRLEKVFRPAVIEILDTARAATSHNLRISRVYPRARSPADNKRRARVRISRRFAHVNDPGSVARPQSSVCFASALNVARIVAASASSTLFRSATSQIIVTKWLVSKCVCFSSQADFSHV